MEAVDALVDVSVVYIDVLVVVSFMQLDAELVKAVVGLAVVVNTYGVGLGRVCDGVLEAYRI